MELGIVVPPFHPPALIEMTVDGAHAIGADSLWTFDDMLGVLHPELYGETGFAELIPDSVDHPISVRTRMSRAAGPGRLTSPVS